MSVSDLIKRCVPFPFTNTVTSFKETAAHIPNNAFQELLFIGGITLQQLFDSFCGNAIGVEDTCMMPRSSVSYLIMLPYTAKCFKKTVSY